MVEKRAAPDGALGDAVNGAAHGEADAAKRPRLDGVAAAGAGGAPAAAGKPAMTLSALEKAKRALQLQKELKEKLAKKLQSAAPAAPAAAPGAAGVAAPAPAPAGLPPPPPLPGGLTSLLPEPPATAPAPPPEAFIDPRMSNASLRKLERRPRRGFEFVEQGEFQRQAEVFRLQQRYGKDAVPPPREKRPIGAAGDPNQVPIGSNPNLVPVGEGSPAPQQEEIEAVEQVPDVEWWDAKLLATGSYEADVPADPNAPVAINHSKITILIEHPVPIQPPSEAPPPAPQPLKLTRREMKKMRTQKRIAREKEKQDLIRQGLLEPAKPKVKLSNLYRVLGEQAVLDPTAIEMETRKQMEERRAAHLDRGEANKLTPAERKEKKLRKLFDDNGETIASVFRIERLDNKLNRMKVDINAKDNHMSGTALVTPEFCLVVVEGCNKATKRMTKLMLRRIDWELPPLSKDDPAGDQEEEEEEEDRPPNSCVLVWQGLVKEKAFEGFKLEECRTVEHAQQVLSQRNVGHYWDAAHNFKPGESVPIVLK